MIKAETNGVVESARACLIYSAVPFIGIVFVPFAIGFALAAAGRSRKARIYLLVGAASLAGHLILWRLLYIVPQMAIGGL